MFRFYGLLKYSFICIWSVYVIAPFMWAITTSFKDFNSVTGGATYIPWIDFEPTLDGWRQLLLSPSEGGVALVQPYLNSIMVTLLSSAISLVLGTLAAYSLSRFKFRAGFIKNSDMFDPIKPAEPVTSHLYFLFVSLFIIVSIHHSLGFRVSFC